MPDTLCLFLAVRHGVELLNRMGKFMCQDRLIPHAAIPATKRYDSDVCNEAAEHPVGHLIVYADAWCFRWALKTEHVSSELHDRVGFRYMNVRRISILNHSA